MFPFIFFYTPDLGAEPYGEEDSEHEDCRIQGRTFWYGKNCNPLPFQTLEEVLDFLETAEVVSIQEVGSGTTGVRKLLLRNGEIEAHAAFRHVRIDRQNVRMDDGSRKRFFRDHFAFEKAAFELSRVLGLDNVPPVVIRKVSGIQGSVQLWIESAFTEGQRQSEKMIPREHDRWLQDLQHLRIFDNLIHNDDRNPGNILYDSNWKLWMIDHTRSFRRNRELKNISSVTRCGRDLWKRLKSLTEGDIREAMGDFLHPAEVNGLIHRHRLIIEYLQNRINETGESGVLIPQIH
jgi:hypothetical protein